MPATALGVIAGAVLVKSQPEWVQCVHLAGVATDGVAERSQAQGVRCNAAGQFLALRSSITMSITTF
ncbi:hypothetical protein [Xylella fastidiosa]|uniref:hypothetical protein n=1 Tax=Xylella fastidiosa TaxID=2371 RepID=UPI001E5BBDEC|nr:hypothetical protein [Xylella fastidiosa]